MRATYSSNRRSTSSSSICSNCGKRGHYFRECHEPTTSLGLIVFCRSPPPLAAETSTESADSIRWLLIRRRNSIGLMEFMRGKYELRDDAGIQALIDQMTLDERAAIQTQSFPDLWRSLWKGVTSRRYNAEYEQARAKFDVLRNRTDGRDLGAFCRASTTAWTDPEWGFPKGRRTSTESELACALRETWEETGIPSSALRVLPGSEPIVEEYCGSNGITYRHRYWIAEISAAHAATVRCDPANEEQCREVGEVRFCSVTDAINLIRPYNAEKRAALVAAASRVVARE